MASLPPSQEPTARALARMAKVDTNIKPNDPRHIQAYVALRETCRRVNAAQLLKFLESQEPLV